MSKGFIKLSLLFVSVLVLVGLAGYFISASKVSATQQLQDWSCQSNGPQCGTNNGTEKVCPEGYTRNENTCRKVDSYTCPIIKWDYFSHHVNVQYEKSQDPTKCHRPSDNTLDDVYGMGHTERGWFKFYHPEWLDAEVTYSYKDPITQSCTAGEPRYDSCDEAGQCSDKCGITEPYQVPDGKGGFIQCGTTPACTVDQCINIEGVQEVVPEGYYQTDDDGLRCFPNPTGTPTPTPEPPSNNGGGGGPVGAPQCTDQRPLVLPSNIHVIRKGSEATVNFFTQSSNANIYFKEVSSPTWQHALRDIPVTGGYVSVTIHDLVPALGYTFGVQSANSCAGGEVALGVVVDGPTSTTFQFSYWEWLK